MFYANIRLSQNFKVITEKFHITTQCFVISRKIRATLSKFHVVFPIKRGYNIL